MVKKGDALKSVDERLDKIESVMRQMCGLLNINNLIDIEEEEKPNQEPYTD